MTFLAGRTNRATYGAYLVLYFAIFSLSVAYQIKIPGEVLFAFICIPRLHDLGRSGWWVVVGIAIELGVVIAATMNPATKGFNLLIGVAALFMPAIALLIIPGQSGINRFGDAPPRGVGLPAGIGRS